MLNRLSNSDSDSIWERGFLPDQDPLYKFVETDLQVLDQIGHDIPSMLQDKGFRQYVQNLSIPELPQHWNLEQHSRELQLYYVRLGFLASAYVNQVDLPRATKLPKNIATPLVKVCDILQRPPILSYDGYALYNWRRFDPNKPIALGNIDTIQNFVHLYDEHWFILVHVDIEQKAAQVIKTIAQCSDVLQQKDCDKLNHGLRLIAESLWQQVEVLKRIPEKMAASLYYKDFRPYIRFFQNVIYEGADAKAADFRGETGAQSSIMPTLVNFLKIPHQASNLTNHLKDMRQYMPAAHRTFLLEVENMPAVKDLAEKEIFNEVLEAMAQFREVHFQWANDYIQKMCQDDTGTGGTPYIQWLKQLIDETRGHKKL